MKSVHLIFPVVAVGIAGVLVGAQRKKISRLENESVVLRKHIAAEKSRIENQGDAGQAIRPAKPETPDEGIDWLEIAEIFGDMKSGGGVADMRTLMSFQSKLQRMDTDQLLAALDQIQSLELDGEERAMLEAMLMGPLATKDPELFLTRFSDRLGDENSATGFQLASALGEWAKKDPAAAVAWFDKEIAAGTFDSKSLDGKSRIRLHFETNLVASLISTDPAAVKARIQALPADQRKDALGGVGFHSLKDEDRAAYADLVRSSLSEEERYEVFGQQASMIAMTGGGLEEAGEYLDGIGATGEERIKAAEHAAKGKFMSNAHQSKVTDEDVDELRDWLGTQAPGSVDRVTGETLGQIGSMGGDDKFQESVAMVLKYHEQGGGDDLLTAFLDNNYRGGENEEVRMIAEKIADPQKREEALENLK